MDLSPLECLSYPLQADVLLRKRKSIRRKLLERDVTWLNKKIAILGGSTTNDIQDFLELFLLREGIRPSFYTSEYNQYWEDAMFDNPALKTFSPDIIFIHTTSRNIAQWPTADMAPEQVRALLEQQFAHFKEMWDRLSAGYACPIIQNNFDRPLYRLLGNKDISDCRGGSNFVYRLNGLLYDYADSHPEFYVHDIDYLAAQFGQGAWQAPQYWNQYKYALNLKAIPEFSRNLAAIIKSIYGKNKKVITVDLDNTLWGGVVGDDGPENLVIGPEVPAGENFSMLQSYLQSLKQIGVLLTVASKNEEQNALAGLQHPNNTLHPDDFSYIAANWNNKDLNIRATAEALNLGLDSFVFADDNPAEREIVRAQVPEVTVLEGETPDRFLELLDHGGFFEVTSLTKDDLARSAMYKANADRIKLQQSFSNYKDYLLSLNMKATIRDFEPMHLQRIAQLTNKSNQFNLTTKRYSDADMLRMSQDPQYIRLYGRLEDKFGDNGIVSVIAGRADGSLLHIELWLMSCRVLKRDMELAMFDQLVAKSVERGITEIIGYYYPTAKNQMVRDFYQSLGFQQVSGDASGNTVWKYPTAVYVPKNQVIRDIII